MKILIVDDEKHVLKALRFFLNQESYPIEIIEEASNGLEAIEKIEHLLPDILFTDMQMPEMDGTKLLEWIHDHHPTMKIIAISSYSQFEYMRHVIKAGGIDYLLKPIDPKQLHDALSKAVDEINLASSQHKQNIKVNIYTPIYKSKVLSDSIAQEGGVHRDLLPLAKEFGIGTKHVHIAIIKLPHYESIAKDLFNADVNLLFFSVTNICNEILTPQCGYAFHYLYAHDECIVVYWGAQNDFQQKLGTISEWIYKLTNSMPAICLGSKQTYIKDLSSGYKEGLLAYEHRLVGERNPQLFYTTTSRPPTHYDFATPLEGSYQDWLLAIKNNNEAFLNVTLDTLSTQLKQFKHMTYRDLQKFLGLYHYYYQLLTTTFLIESKSTLLDETSEKNIDSIDAGIQLIKSQLLSILHHHHAKHVKISLTQQVVQYIHSHYAKPISLSTIANHFYISKEHLSREFKKDTGRTLSTYVTNIRLEKAVSLLSHTDQTIKEIALSLGYADEKYFSKVFKKKYEVSPHTYRISK